MFFKGVDGNTKKYVVKDGRRKKSHYIENLGKYDDKVIENLCGVTFKGVYERNPFNFGDALSLRPSMKLAFNEFDTIE